MLNDDFDISTGFKFRKISVKCPVHILRCPWLRAQIRPRKRFYAQGKLNLLGSSIYNVTSEEEGRGLQKLKIWVINEVAREGRVVNQYIG